MKKILTPLTASLLTLSLSCRWAPVGETNNGEIRRLNAALAEMAYEFKWDFIDTYYLMVAGDGHPMPYLFMPDGEHLSEDGYLRWAKRLRHFLDQHPTYQRITMVGDSITARPYVVPSTISSHATDWSDLLNAGVTDASKKVVAFNQGQDGDTTEEVMERVEAVLATQADCYCLMIGNNDLHQGVPVWDVVPKVRALAQTIATRSGKPVVIQAVMPLLF